jgi:hypothetical protein
MMNNLERVPKGQRRQYSSITLVLWVILMVLFFSHDSTIFVVLVGATSFFGGMIFNTAWFFEKTGTWPSAHEDDN